MISSTKIFRVPAMTYLTTMLRKIFQEVALGAAGRGFLKRLKHTGVFHFHFSLSSFMGIFHFHFLLSFTFKSLTQCYEGPRNEGEPTMTPTIVDFQQGDFRLFFITSSSHLVPNPLCNMNP